ncbi:hypothetical protein [Listeria seeligeri]|uniref:hypothetical protein n=1 Tax=Listeria seeligeri TaxID=1640 RepID=UPI0022EAD6B4|nr:hypothetical protein [Listeria seeligeri]
MTNEAEERVWNRLSEAETTVYNTVVGKNVIGYAQNKIAKILKQEGISLEKYGEYHRARMQEEENK